MMEKNWGIGIETERLPFLQFEDEAPFERDLVLRVLGLQFVESLSDRGLLDQNHGSLEIEVGPPQAQDFADPLTEAQSNQHDGSVGLR